VPATPEISKGLAGTMIDTSREAGERSFGKSHVQ